MRITKEDRKKYTKLGFGNKLKEKLRYFEFTEKEWSKGKPDAFCELLKQCAIEDIQAIAPEKIPSYIAIPMYYDILKTATSSLPIFANEKLYSNAQEYFRVSNRNIWSSNSDHTDGIQSNPTIKCEIVSTSEKMHTYYYSAK